MSSVICSANPTNQPIRKLQVERKITNCLFFDKLRCGTSVFLRNDILALFGERKTFAYHSLDDIPSACNETGPFSISMFSTQRTLIPRKHAVATLAHALTLACQTGDATIATIYDKNNNEIALVDLS